MKPSDILLTDQVAIVTGGGGGIGRAIALAFASAGADVVIGDIVPDRCTETAARVQEKGRQGLGLPTDVSKTDQVRALIDKAVERFGRIDILVNNAGGVRARPFLEQNEASWRKHIDLNLIAMFAATSAAAPVMIKGGRGGSIINVTSIEGARAAPTYSVYAACKAGMINFTRTLAVELGGNSIRVNAIAPDFTPTPGIQGNATGPVDQPPPYPMSPEMRDNQSRRIPLGRPGLEEECGSAAVFLASKMASYITGAILPVDGGTWASGGWIRTRAEGKWSLTG